MLPIKTGNTAYVYAKISLAIIPCGEYTCVKVSQKRIIGGTYHG
jgi:hypothetical protein